jgi:hypothetical protein
MIDSLKNERILRWELVALPSRLRFARDRTEGEKFHISRLTAAITRTSDVALTRQE